MHKITVPPHDWLLGGSEFEDGGLWASPTKTLESPKGLLWSDERLPPLGPSVDRVKVNGLEFDLTPGDHSSSTTDVVKEKGPLAVVQITHKRMAVAGSTRHEHISHVRWYNPSTGEVNTSPVAAMVTWLRDTTHRAYVCDGSRIVDVGVVEANPPYIRTHADGKWSDNLLALPAF